MLLGMAFGHNNANTTTCDDNQTTITALSDTDPGEGIDPDGPGGGGGTTGDTGQLPPPLTNP